MNSDYQPRQWMKYVLLLAGVYNLAWGTLTIAAPEMFLSFLGLEPEIVAIRFWQCIGMIVGVYGIGYLVAAGAPYRHWPITLVGLLGKVFGPIGFFGAVWAGDLPATMSWTILFNDLIWWVPFVLILWGAARYSHIVGSAYEESESDDPLRELRTNTGKRLDDLANEAPQLVVLLRHAGCTFCRQALSDIESQRDEIEATGCRIVFVHLGYEDQSSVGVFQKYNLDDVPRISDPQCRLYRQFGLDLGGFSELFGLRVWIRGFLFGISNGHGIGSVRGNSFQMPGVYLYHCGIILGGFRHESAADRPDYISLAKQIQFEERIAG